MSIKVVGLFASLEVPFVPLQRCVPHLGEHGTRGFQET